MLMLIPFITSEIKMHLRLANAYCVEVGQQTGDRLNFQLKGVLFFFLLLFFKKKLFLSCNYFLAPPPTNHLLPALRFFCLAQ